MTLKMKDDIIILITLISTKLNTCEKRDFYSLLK